MALKKKRLRMRTCPVCDKRFMPKSKLQIYCDRTNRCAMKMFRYREAQRIEQLKKRVEELEKGAA